MRLFNNTIAFIIVEIEGRMLKARICAKIQEFVLKYKSLFRPQNKITARLLLL